MKLWAFFMKSEWYYGFELPEDFTFDEVQMYAPNEEVVQNEITPDEQSDMNPNTLPYKDG